MWKKLELEDIPKISPFLNLLSLLSKYLFLKT